MKSNYKQLGPYIRVVDKRNKELEVDLLLGVSIQKIFIPSIANTIGADMSKYKIIYNKQFAYGPVTSRNGDKISVALLEKEDAAIVSQAYVVFEIIDHEVLNPEYLMMWFRRPEFDRYARFKSHGSARETFDWDEMCEIELPIPSITKQREIVKEYNTIVNRISLNEKLNQKLEETAQTLYKHWFVDFEFPNEDGKPYKSSGGEMTYSNELKQDIPKGWMQDRAENKFSISIGKTPPRSELDCFSMNALDIKWVSIADLKEHHFILDTKEKLTNDAIEKYNVKVIPKNTVIMSFKLTVGKVAITNDAMATNEAIAHFQTEEKYLVNFLYYQLATYDFESLGSTSSIGNAINSKIVKAMPIIIPNKKILLKFDDVIIHLIEKIKQTEILTTKLITMKEILWAKMSKIESTMTGKSA